MGQDIDIDTYLWNERHDLLTKGWVQYRYHQRRCRFWDLVERGSVAISVVLSFSLLGDELKKVLPIIASVIAALGLFSLVFGYADRRQLHKELGARSAAMVGGIERVAVDEISPVIVAAWKAEYAALCAASPPPLKTLTIMCEREHAIATGHPDQIAQPVFVRRLLADFLS